MTFEWKIRTLKDAYKERPPTEYIVDQFFSKGSMSIVYGVPGGFKSMIMADCCACVVAGTDWLPGTMGGGAGIKVEQGAVLWIDVDNGESLSDERIQAVSVARGLPKDAPFHYISMPAPSLQFHASYKYEYIDQDGEKQTATLIDVLIYLINLIRELDAKMVVIDNLGLVTGDVEENSAEMAQVMAHVRTITEKTKTAMIVIHHSRKGGANGGNEGDALRGHSSINASPDLSLQVYRDGKDQEITLKSTKTRRVEPPRVRAEFNFEHRFGTRDLSKAWFSGIAEVRGENPIREAINIVLAENPDGLTKGILAAKAREFVGGEKLPGVNLVRNWIDEMAAQGDIEVKDGERNAKIYTQ